MKPHIRLHYTAQGDVWQAHVYQGRNGPYAFKTTRYTVLPSLLKDLAWWLEPGTHGANYLLNT